jgi:hypothetical protein
VEDKEVLEAAGMKLELEALRLEGGKRVELEGDADWARSIH